MGCLARETFPIHSAQSSQEGTKYNKSKEYLAYVILSNLYAVPTPLDAGQPRKLSVFRLRQPKWAASKHKVEKILKGSLDLIPSPSPSVKIQLMLGKASLTYNGKRLLGIALLTSF